jgi:hypothetical protein
MLIGLAVLHNVSSFLDLFERTHVPNWVKISKHFGFHEDHCANCLEFLSLVLKLLVVVV